MRLPPAARETFEKVSRGSSKLFGENAAESPCKRKKFHAAFWEREKTLEKFNLFLSSARRQFSFRAPFPFVAACSQNVLEGGTGENLFSKGFPRLIQ
ncbi:hypothetical protein [Pseudodesulfovibrio tunisiensis]|uniref:hypothetical protein n=1 Tax=Pseudodesulfovibrio tunisiensis TaxID=463192 RepID=UPI001FB32B6D|nr:hypothetical protein [Pseudodesulfovibrio tunisiensis]